MGIFATTAEVQRKVGAGASATSNSETYINDFMTQAESYINVLTATNYSDTYTTLNVDKKGILKEAASNLAAIYVVQYDISGYDSTREAENIINILWQRFVQCIKILNDSNARTFLNAT